MSPHVGYGVLFGLAFAKAHARPQALASLTLPIVALEQVIRTHGAVAYPEEVAALVKVPATLVLVF